jgi:1-phosphofructokinase/tagatose 6-phosphate kinase
MFTQWVKKMKETKDTKGRRFLTVCMNPTLQKTLVFSGLVPDTVNRTGEYRLDASGKGINVSRVLSQLGKDTCHLTQLGGVLRPLFLELCAADGLCLEWVESSSPVRFCYTLVNRKDKSVTELVEESERVGEGTEERLLDSYRRLVPGFSSVIISGTKASGFPDTLIPEMVRIAKAEGLQVILDVRGQDLLNSLPWEPDLIKPNLYEFAATFAPELVFQNRVGGNGEISAVREKIGEIWQEIYRSHPVRLILTRGSGSVWYAEKGELEEYTFEPVEPLNTTGSGDAFTAGLAAGLGDGDGLREAIAQGARCGALNAALIRPGVIR